MAKKSAGTTKEETVLYRKYRPADFSEVRGQEHVTKVLEGAIAQENIAHAYLFSGSRGTGKTSIARILARSIGTSDLDVYEIDAASNRGIDDIRELRDAVHVLPFESEKKVYIIDEVHMLTKEAFNALLKTLEEPPAHVIFMLATTEEDKLPETIISRCQTFTFKKPTQQVLRDTILDVAKKETFSLEKASADLIVTLADGSFRDALGILQKIMVSSTDKKVSIEEVEMVTGAPKSGVVNEVLHAIEEGNTEKGIMALKTAGESGIDMKLFGRLLLQKVRAVLLLRYAKDMKEYVTGHFSDEDVAVLEEIAKTKETHINSKTLLRLLEAYDATGRSYITQLPLELALIDIIEEQTQ